MFTAIVRPDSGQRGGDAKPEQDDEGHGPYLSDAW